MAADTPIGTRIARRRQVLGLTQQDLAAKLGVSKSTVANWETGKHFPRRYIGRVEDVLGVRLDAEHEPDLVDDETRALIYRKFSREDAAVIIGTIEQTLRPKVTSPGGETTASQGR